MTTRARASAATAIALILLAAAACDQAPPLAVPTGDEVASFYTLENEFEGEVSGNVAVLTVYQPSEQLRRGGSLWAKVGPYVFLFSEPTQRLLGDFPGLAAVRVITRDPSDVEVSRATLERQALNALTWRRALNIAGHARRDGGRQLALLEDLIEWGEDHTDFEYSPRFVR
jgi:hypothetical protein